MRRRVTLRRKRRGGGVVEAENAGLRDGRTGTYTSLYGDMGSPAEKTAYTNAFRKGQIMAARDSGYRDAINRVPMRSKNIDKKANIYLTDEQISAYKEGYESGVKRRDEDISAKPEPPKVEDVPTSVPTSPAPSRRESQDPVVIPSQPSREKLYEQMGYADGIRKQKMDESVFSKDKSLSESYVKGYKQGREEIYAKTGSNRRYKKKKTRRYRK